MITGRLSGKQVSRIIDMWDEGRSVGSIARELRVPKNTISSLVNRLRKRGVPIAARKSPIIRKEDK